MLRRQLHLFVFARVEGDGATAGSPVGRDAELAVGALDQLVGADESKGLVHVSAHRNIVDRGVLENALRVHDEEPAEREAVIEEDAVAGRDGLVEVGNDGEADAFNAAVLSSSAVEGHVNELRVTRSSDNLQKEELQRRRRRRRIKAISTLVLIAVNSSMRSLNASSSIGHTYYTIIKTFTFY